MAEAEPLTEHAHPVPLPGWLVALCRWAATLGGGVLLGMMALTVLSVAGRGLFNAPIPGDFELVEMGAAITIACFLPWAQVMGGNVLVDFFTMRAGARTNHALEALGDLLYLLVGALLTWRMWIGAEEFRVYGEQSMVLRLPVWWSFGLILPAMALLIVATFFTMIGHIRKARA